MPVSSEGEFVANFSAVGWDISAGGQQDVQTWDAGAPGIFKTATPEYFATKGCLESERISLIVTQSDFF